MPNGFRFVIPAEFVIPKRTGIVNCLFYLIGKAVEISFWFSAPIRQVLRTPNTNPKETIAKAISCICACQFAPKFIFGDVADDRDVRSCCYHRRLLRHYLKGSSIPC